MKTIICTINFLGNRWFNEDDCNHYIFSSLLNMTMWCINTLLRTMHAKNHHSKTKWGACPKELSRVITSYTEYIKAIFIASLYIDHISFKRQDNLLVYTKHIFLHFLGHVGMSSILQFYLGNFFHVCTWVH